MLIIDSFRFFDIELFWRINAANSPFLDTFFSIVTNLGSGWMAIPIIAAIVLLKTPRPALMHTVIFIALAMSLSGIANSRIKSLVARPRPQTYFAHVRAKALESGADLGSQPGPQSLIPHVVGPQWKFRSFPSGHANTSFAAATVLYLLLGGWWALGYAAAALVAYSRVYMGVHFPLDTVAGGLLGISVTTLVFYAYSAWMYDFARERRTRMTR